MARKKANNSKEEPIWRGAGDGLCADSREVKSPKQTMRTAFQAGLINDAEKWMEMIQKRNLAGHAYDQTILEIDGIGVQNRCEKTINLLMNN